MNPLLLLVQMTIYDPGANMAEQYNQMNDYRSRLEMQQMEFDRQLNQQRDEINQQIQDQIRLHDSMYPPR